MLRWIGNRLQAGDSPEGPYNLAPAELYSILNTGHLSRMFCSSPLLRCCTIACSGRSGIKYVSPAQYQMPHEPHIWNLLAKVHKWFWLHRLLVVIYQNPSAGSQ